MVDKGLDTREKIIQATINLIKKEMDVKKITVRSIASEAEIGSGLVNYYFDSKEKLIDEAVQMFINSVIEDSDNTFNNANLSAEERLKDRVKTAARFLAVNPGISRVSILTDMKNGKENDNSYRVVNAYYSILKEMFADKDDIELIVMSQQIVAAIHEIFLRAESFKKQAGIDYFNDEQRDRLVEQIIDNVIN